MEGIYVAYATGSEGYSVIMLVLRNNRITGADAGGLKYFGKYSEKKKKIIGEITAEFPAGSSSIAGGEIGDQPYKLEMPFTLKFKDIGTGAITLESPLGQINASVHKLQELP